MNTEKKVLLIICLCCYFSCTITAQSTFQVGGIPSVNLNYKFQKDWSFNFRLESRQLLKSGAFNDNDSEGYEYVLTDYSLIAAKTVGLNSRISGGYLFRFRDGNTIHRFIQQYTIIQKLNGFRLAHRLVTDQTYSPITSPEYRLRYRLVTELPLNGQSADRKEFYLKIGNEYLNSIQDTDYDLEIRVIPMLGYTVTKNHKVEIGLDYRVNSFVNGYARHSFWTSLNWFIEI